MRILIDADGCPVVDIAIDESKKRKIECLLLCDTSHVFEKPGVQTLTFSKGADSVDFALVNMARPGDLVITQDYGLAAMCLARSARALNQNGMEYSADNIEALLIERHTSKKIRAAGGRLKGSSKRTAAQDAAFRRKLTDILSQEEQK